MSLPSTTLFGTLALGTVGAVVAAGAALSGPAAHPVPQGDNQPVTVVSPSTVPCPAGTKEHEDECVRVVLAPAEQVPVAPVQPAAPVATHVEDAADDSPEPAETETSEAEHEDAQDSDHEDGEQEDGDHEDSEQEDSDQSDDSHEDEPSEDGGSDD